MQIGIIYPQTEFGTDPAAIHEFAQTAEGLGFSHIVAYDHVLGANPDRPDWSGPYTFESTFLSPFLLFSFMASVTARIGFLTGILILPQRQTALVAKQAATLDVLSQGRFRLGVGNGWNAVEFVALGENFRNRGRRIEEQVAVLRRLWTEPLVRFKGEWHDIPDAGVNPLPVQRPIPIWFGGHAEAVLKRAARIGDGWLPTYRSAAQAQPHLERIWRYLDEADRKPGSFGIEARLLYGAGDPSLWTAEAEAWRTSGATHVSVNTMRSGLDSPEAHLAALQTLADSLL